MFFLFFLKILFRPIYSEYQKFNSQKLMSINLVSSSVLSPTGCCRGDCANNDVDDDAEHLLHSPSSWAFCLPSLSSWWCWQTGQGAWWNGHHSSLLSHMPPTAFSVQWNWRSWQPSMKGFGGLNFFKPMGLGVYFTRQALHPGLQQPWFSSIHTCDNEYLILNVTS